ncbi:MAG: hypothetical protein RIM84_05060 [Alphaproteobacteria bacterium]
MPPFANRAGGRSVGHIRPSPAATGPSEPRAGAPGRLAIDAHLWFFYAAFRPHSADGIRPSIVFCLEISPRAVACSMIRRAILHIGQSKTGTSSLQASLARNRENLANEGLLYPDVSVGGMPIDIIAHNVVAESLIDIRRYPWLTKDEYFCQFADQCDRQGCDAILLSGESFFSTPHVWTLAEGHDYLALYRHKLEVLKSFLDGIESCTVVVYLRPQEDWFESGVGHIIRYEGLLRRRIYENDNQLFELLAPHMDYAALLGLWDEVLQPDKLVAVPYERERLIDRDVVRDFAARIGVPLDFDLAQSVREENTSLDRRYLWLKNVLNRLDRDKNEERVIIDRLGTLNDRLSVRRKWVISDELRERCRRRFADSNDELAERFGIAPDPFFTPPPNSKTTDPINETEDGLAALMAFDHLYSAPSTRLFLARTRLATRLRVGYPTLHTAAKRLVRLVS